MSKYLCIFQTWDVFGMSGYAEDWLTLQEAKSYAERLKQSNGIYKVRCVPWVNTSTHLPAFEV